jgi:hypothetical protein
MEEPTEDLPLDTPSEMEEVTGFDQSLLKRKRKEHTASELLELTRKRVQREDRIWGLYANLTGLDKRSFSCFIDNPDLLPNDTTDKKEAKARYDPTPTLSSIANTKKAKMIEIAKNCVLKSVQLRSFKETELQGLSHEEMLDMFRAESYMYRQLKIYQDTNQAKVRRGLS